MLIKLDTLSGGSARGKPEPEFEDSFDLEVEYVPAENGSAPAIVLHLTRHRKLLGRTETDDTIYVRLGLHEASVVRRFLRDATKWAALDE